MQNVKKLARKFSTRYRFSWIVARMWHQLKAVNSVASWTVIIITRLHDYLHCYTIFGELYANEKIAGVICGNVERRGFSVTVTVKQRRTRHVFIGVEKSVRATLAWARLQLPPARPPARWLPPSALFSAALASKLGAFLCFASPCRVKQISNPSTWSYALATINCLVVIFLINRSHSWKCLFEK